MRTSFHILPIIFLSPFISCGCSRSASSPAKQTASKEGKEAGAEGVAHGEQMIRLTPDQIRSAGIQLSKASARGLGVDTEVSGEIASDTDRIIQLRPEHPGAMEQLLVAVGDTVDAGQILVRYKTDTTPSRSEEIKAVQSGIVVGINAEPGSRVDSAIPAVTLADISRLRCGLDIYEKDISRIKKGQKVKIKVVAFPRETFLGSVTYISPRVDENSRTIKVRVDIANTDGKLKFGMFVKGFIQVGERRTLTVPDAAIQTVKGKPTVFEAEGEGTFVPREVRLGERAGGWIEILSGLRDGATVVGEGSFILKAQMLKGEMGDND
jgi:multidrug efflux pump subunit AcrA (membrane-fusion protein)